MPRPPRFWSIALILGWCLCPREAGAQAPTIDTGVQALPGSQESLLGPAPGAGGLVFDDSPGANAPLLSGRAGTTGPHVPASVTTPGSGNGPTALQEGITAPKPKPVQPTTLYGSLSLPALIDDEGPAQGLTLDAAIDIMLRENLDLRSKFFEIPQAQADILQAGLRANPVFYADSQLIPYGQFNRASPGGPTQYDVNISYPIDASQKRRARIQVATRAKRVLEAQYQNAVRLAIDTLAQAFVDVLAARQTVIYTRKSVEGLEQLLSVERLKLKLDQSTRADVARVEIQRDTAKISLFDAEENYRKAKRALAVQLNISPESAETIQLRGKIYDPFPPPPQLDELYRVALTVRPDIVSYKLGIDRAQADVKLAKANRYTDIYVLYQPYTFQNNQPYGVKSPTSWALGVTVPLPIYNRNQGGIERAKQNVTQSRIQLASLERQVTMDVSQAYHEYQVSRQAVEKLLREVLPDATRVLEDSRHLYKGGDRDVTFFLQAQSFFNDNVKQFLDTMVRHRRSMLSLNTTLGQRVLP
jgi:cobalt-zinc-cadmium efflux system outer membrane protein